MKAYLQPTSEQGQEFFKNFKGKGSFVMLNLMKFNDKANYNDVNQKDLSGEEAYQLYLKEIKSELELIGSVILFKGKPNAFLVGPIDEQWDFMLLVKHKSIDSFLEFSKSEVYLKNVKHQTAAIKDFRLLPVSEK